MTIDGNTTYTYYIYDGEKPILEFDLSSALVAKNVYGKSFDEILMRTDYVVNPAGQTYYYQDNHEGSITHLTNGSGAVIESYRYDAFGLPTINDGNGNILTSPATGLPRSALNNRFMFTGREYIKQFGIYEYRARAYHPGIGRFMSEDPKGFDAGDYNLFRYCANDPLDLTDPTGLAYAPGTSPTGSVVNPPSPYIGFSPMEGDVSRIGTYMSNYNVAVAAVTARAATLAFMSAAGGGQGQQIKVNQQVDAAARSLGPRLVKISETNSDNSAKGTGWERGKTVGLVDGKAVEGDRLNFAISGTRFKGPQTIQWTDAPPGSTEYVFVHSHTALNFENRNGATTLTSNADRLSANQARSAIYTFAASGRGGYMAERYRPSSFRADRINGINGITERLVNGAWLGISD